MALSTPLKWGTIKFNSKGADYTSLKKVASWEWAELARFARAPTLHFTGRGADTVTVEGTIRTFFGGVSSAVGCGKIKELEEAADKRKPEIMVTGLGEVLGRWVVTEISETQQDLMDNGAFLSQPFSVSFKRYPEEDGR